MCTIDYDRRGVNSWWVFIFLIFLALRSGLLNMYASASMDCTLTHNTNTIYIVLLLFI